MNTSDNFYIKIQAKNTLTFRYFAHFSRVKYLGFLKSKSLSEGDGTARQERGFSLMKHKIVFETSGVCTVENFIIFVARMQIKL